MSARNKRIHGQEAAGAGDIGSVTGSEFLGPCPSCGAELRVACVKNPLTSRIARALLHPMPFCTYYGETDPTTVEHSIKRKTDPPALTSVLHPLEILLLDKGDYDKHRDTRQCAFMLSMQHTPRGDLP